MQSFIYFLILPFIYCISLLPFKVLYLLSDFLYVIIYRIFPYRRKVIYENLRLSFPNKSEQEIDQIAKDFYAYFADLMVETIKMITMTKSQVARRCPFKDDTLLNELYKKHKNIIIVMGHYGNWEWAALGTSIGSPYRLRVIYHVLSNISINRLFVNTRSKFGARLITMEGTLRDIIFYKDKPTATALVADQAPGPGHAYWTSFLNQDTAVFTGPEKIAKKFNMPVVFGNITRIKRGVLSNGYRIIN